MITVAGPFSTQDGQIRLTFECPADKRDELIHELRANATVASSLDEFKQLSLKSVRRYGGSFGEFLHVAPVSSANLKSGIRAAAHQTDPIEALDAVKRAIGQASPDERRDLVCSSSYEHERRYIASLLRTFDSGAEAEASQLSHLVGELDSSWIPD